MSVDPFARQGTGQEGEGNWPLGKKTKAEKGGDVPAAVITR